MSSRDLSVNDGTPRFSSPFHGMEGGTSQFSGFRFYNPSRAFDRKIDSVGNYRLLNPIGSGNFGVVYLAEHAHLGHRVAVKIFQQMHHNPEILRAFTGSARFLSALDHPHIVGMRDFGVAENIAYLVMDLIVPGVAIDLVIQQMPLNATIELLAQVASALEYAHRAVFDDEFGTSHTGIFHGDVKPANILVGNDQAYLTDFMLPNLEEFQERDHGHPCFPFYDTRWYGTPMYMAPEQLRGIVNAQTDVFAFGVTAFEMLTGRYPWDTEREFDASYFESGVPVRIPPVAQYNRAVPEELARMIESCLSPHPGDRPGDFGQIRRVLQDSLRDTAGPSTMVPAGRQKPVYDVALSFAGSERHLAEQIYLKLRDHCSVYYDGAPDHKADAWGADLSTHLHEIYAEQARYCLVLISREYVERVWTNWERRAILQRMVNSRTAQFVLPLIVEEVDVPGFPSTIGMLRLAEEGVNGVVAAFLRKLRAGKDAPDISPILPAESSGG